MGKSDYRPTDGAVGLNRPVDGIESQEYQVVSLQRPRPRNGGFRVERQNKRNQCIHV
jgi:hypothetical protein